MSTFVTVGNATQSFERLLEAVAAATPLLPRPIVVQRGVGRAFHSAWEIHDFLPMERFEQLVAGASVLIMHAGAGSIINALRSGKQPIVVPRRALLKEHVDDHQLEFASALAVAGKVVVAETVESLREAITRVSNQVLPPTNAKLATAVAELLRDYAKEVHA